MGSLWSQHPGGFTKVGGIEVLSVRGVCVCVCVSVLRNLDPTVPQTNSVCGFSRKRLKMHSGQSGSVKAGTYPLANEHRGCCGLHLFVCGPAVVWWGLRRCQIPLCPTCALASSCCSAQTQGQRTEGVKKNFCGTERRMADCWQFVMKWIELLENRKYLKQTNTFLSFILESTSFRGPAIFYLWHRKKYNSIEILFPYNYFRINYY